MRSAQLIQVLLQENILLINICKNQVHLRFIIAVPQNGLDDLQHRGNPRSTRNHPERADQVRPVVEVPLGTFDADGLTDFQTRDVFGNVARWVGLNEEGELAFFMI